MLPLFKNIYNSNNITYKFEATFPEFLTKILSEYDLNRKALQNEGRSFSYTPNNSRLN
jgi:hypothetical protein